MASASVMRSTAPPSRKAGHVGSLSGHAARITYLRTLSWSSGVAHHPGGTSRFPPSLRRSTASKGRFLDFLEVPWLAQHNHPYTSPTRTCRSRPGGKRLGGNGSGGMVWVWVGLAGARYLALSLPTAAAAANAGEASVARAGFFPRLRGVLGVAAWPAEAVARPAGAAVATPRAPSSFCSAAAAAASEAPVARAGSVPRVRGVLGVAAWPAEAVSRPAVVAAAAPRAPPSLSFAAVAAADDAPVARAGSAPRFRGVLGVAAWSAEALVRPPGAAVAISRAPFLLYSAAAAALGDAPGSCVRAAPRVGGVPGAAVRAAAWLAGAAVSASCASGAPSRGGAAGLAA